jgi:choline dehydrogenase-like flavoprotein
MDVRNLNALPEGETIETDLLIVGGGAAGLTIAREFFGTGWKVLVAESGDIQQTDEHEKLNEVVLESETVPESWVAGRRDYHGHQAEKWSADVQRFGVRCRGLGGSTAAWAGKSAQFNAHDYVTRDWLPVSGWPFDEAHLRPYIRRAERHLNLGEGSYGDDFWDRYSGKAKKPGFDPAVFSSFLWQFARSRTNPLSMMRMGPDFMREDEANMRVLVNATARCVTPVADAGGQHVEVDFVGLGGGKARVRAKKVVIACGALENARLLLASKTVNPNGLGNDRDQVGRYLMDHMITPVVRFEKRHTKEISYRFGFFGLQSNQRVDMYMHGIGLNLPVQAREALNNAGAFCVAELAEDDPWAALAALLRGKSDAWLRDLLAVLKAPAMMVTGAGRLFLQSDRVPMVLRKAIVDTMVRLMPNFVVEEYQTQGIPHKLVSCGFDAIVEQEPLAHNRVMLSDKLNALGEPLPLVRWEPGERPVRTLMRMGELIREQFIAAGMPAPILEDWIARGDLAAAPIVDTAHTSGTTRMSDDETTGAVDANCKLRHCEGVYLAGGSVLPTCGHANPTLMITSVAIRLADHLKQELQRG